MFTYLQFVVIRESANKIAYNYYDYVGASLNSYLQYIMKAAIMITSETTIAATRHICTNIFSAEYRH